MIKDEIERIKKEFQEKAEKLPLDNLFAIEKWLDNIPDIVQPKKQNDTKPKIKRKLWKQGEFGKKYIKHYGENADCTSNHYRKEYMWWRNHNHKCRWE